MSIALHIICKDEVEVIDRLIKTYHTYFDSIDVAVDDEKAFKEISNIEHPKLNTYFYEWDGYERELGFPKFDKKRNFLVDKCTEDWYFRLDTDDEISDPTLIKAIVDKADNSKADLICCYYDYARDADGNTHAAHNRETIIRNSGKYYWNKHIHENLIPVHGKPSAVIENSLKIIHHLDAEHAVESRNRNLKFLFKEYEDTKDNPDPRTLAYLGRMLYPMGKLKEAKAFLEEHISKSGWDEDRCISWCMLADIMLDQGNTSQAIACCNEALQERPDYPDGYLKMHWIFYKTGKWEKAIHWGKLGLALTRPKTFMLIDEAASTWRPAISMAHAYLMSNKVTEAKKFFDIAEKYAPNLDWVKENKRLFEDAVLHKSFLDKFMWLLEFNKMKGKEQVQSMFDIIPPELQKHELLVKLRHRYSEPRQWDDNEIAIFCGQSWEEWSAPSVLKGIGGSEEAVIYNSKELVKLGYKVTVFCNCGEMEGEFEGVTYKQFFEFNPFDNYNIVIAWRGNIFGDIKAKKRIIWLHDVPIQGLLKKEDVHTYDKIMVLSEYHKSLLPDYIPEHKISLTTNGINLKDFELKKQPSRNLKRLIYTSSYDRGIQNLLEVWADVIKEVPEAELHLFYGWDCYDEMMKKGHRSPDFKVYMQKLMSQPGVFEHGRVNHKELIKEFYKSGIYAYPSHFCEISCISAMKAQACGCVPLVFKYAALSETVKAGVKLEGIGNNKEDMVRYKEELIKLLKDSAYQEELRKEVVTHKEEFGWDKVAKQWKDEIFSLEGNDYRSMDDYKKEYTTNGEFKLSNFDNGTIMYHRRYQFVVENIQRLGIKSILDVGCSDGAMTFAINEITKIKVDGVDADAKAVLFAQSYADKSEYDSKYYHSVVEEFEPEQKYEAVACLEMIEHVIDPKSVLDKLESMVEDGGYVIISTPDKNGFFGEANFNPQHINHYDKEALEELIGKDRIVDWDTVTPDLLTVVYKK